MYGLSKEVRSEVEKRVGQHNGCVWGDMMCNEMLIVLDDELKEAVKERNLFMEFISWILSAEKK